MCAHVACSVCGKALTEVFIGPDVTLLCKKHFLMYQDIRESAHDKTLTWGNNAIYPD
jgi:hypothetical protein